MLSNLKNYSCFQVVSYLLRQKLFVVKVIEHILDMEIMNIVKTNFPAIDIKTLKQGNYMLKDT